MKMEAVGTFRVFLNTYQTVTCHCIGISTIYTCYTEHWSKYWFLFLCSTCEQNSSSTKGLHLYAQGIITKWKKLFISLKNNLNHCIIVWRIFQLHSRVVPVLVRISSKTNQCVKCIPSWFFYGRLGNNRVSDFLVVLKHVHMVLQGFGNYTGHHPVFDTYLFNIHKVSYCSLQSLGVMTDCFIVLPLISASSQICHYDLKTKSKYYLQLSISWKLNGCCQNVVYWNTPQNMNVNQLTPHDGERLT